MSEDAIKFELSQERLRRELAKGPANYRAIARAELEVRRSEQQLRGENERLERQFRETGRQADKTFRGMLAGSGALRGLGRNLAFASAGFLGGTGLVYGMRTAINAASNLEEQTNKTRVTFGKAGDDVVKWAGQTATSIGLASDQALQYSSTIGGILNVSGLAREESGRLSRELVELAADMASFNNVSIEDALEAIRSGLVGESEPLRRLQVLLSESTVKQEAYRIGIAKTGAELTEAQKVQARYSLILRQTGDQQGDFARTQDGLANSQRTLSALWREAQIIVGQALVPSFKEAVSAAREWFAEDKNREQLQRTVNQLVEDGEGVVRGLVSALRLVKTVSEPVVDALGGVAGAVEKLTLLWVAMKVKAVFGFGATAAASSTAATKMVADAGRVEAAWDAATRPRVISVTSAGGYVGARGRGGRGGLPGALPILTTNPALITAGVILATPNASGAAEGERRAGRAALFNGELAEEYPFLTIVAGMVARGQGTPRMVNLIKSLGEPPWSARKLAFAERLAERMMGGNQGRGPHRGALPTASTWGRDNTTSTTGGGGRGGFTFAAFESQMGALEERALDAGATPGTADDVRVWKAQLALVRRALRELKLTRDQRMQLKQERNSILADLARIEEQEDQEAAAAEAKRKAKRKAAAEARAKMREEGEKELANLVKNSEARAKRSRDRINAILEAEGKRNRAKAKAARDADKPLTAAEVHRMLFDFARGLHGTIDQFGDNAGDSAADYGIKPDPHNQLMLHELARQTDILERFTGAVRHPMTGYHRTEGTTLLTGVGF